MSQCFNDANKASFLNKYSHRIILRNKEISKNSNNFKNVPFLRYNFFYDNFKFYKEF